MNSLTLAVISDLHIGDGARSIDLRPAHDKSKEAKIPIEDGYCAKFLAYLKQKNLRADYLILPGDITHAAQPAEVILASNFITSAASVLQVETENIVFVPGNHDVDWSVLKIPDNTGLRWQQRYDPIRQKDHHFNSIIARGAGDILSDPHFTIWQLKDLLVVGYNSSHHDDPNRDHYGFVNPKHLIALRETLASLQYSEHVARLFLVHHHPIQYSDPTAESPDRSVMVNAEDLHSFLRDFKFDILVHGHKHLPRFTTQSLEGSRDIAFLCAGSFSVTLDSRWTGTVSNQFHLIDIEGRDTDEGQIHGKVRSWAYYYSRGWEPSTKLFSGIPHIEPFGTYTRHTHLQTFLRPLITERLNSKGYVEWSWIIKQSKKLRHLRPEVVISVLNGLADELSFKTHGDTPDKLVLLKEDTQ